MIPFLRPLHSRGRLAVIASLLTLQPLLAESGSNWMKASPSVLVQEQADSPISWRNWGPPAFAEAAERGVPLYVFVAWPASEPVRDTLRQSLQDAEIATWINTHFVPVFVDGDFQPEVAALARHVAGVLRQQTGWPVHLWLTPELQPLEVASYLAPTEEWGGKSFRQVMRQAGEAWTANPSACRATAAVAKAALSAETGWDLSPDNNIGALLAKASAVWCDQADRTVGGFSTSPKRPQPELCRFLLAASAPDIRDVGRSCLAAAAQGADWDPLDGGFFRYCLDAHWHEPYPQKLLVDQARMLLALLDAAKRDPDPLWQARAHSVVRYIVERLARGDGSFSAGEDGTIESATNYYLWTEAEVSQILGNRSGAVTKACSVTPSGNIAPEDDPSGRYTGKNFLRLSGAADQGLTNSLHQLQRHREQRPSPARLALAPAGAHGWVLAALARAGAELSDEKGREGARSCFAYIKNRLCSDGALPLQRYPGGAPASTADLAGVLLGLREYAQLTHSQEALALIERIRPELLATVDQSTGRLLALKSPAKLPLLSGLPALPEPVSVEALALLACPDQPALFTLARQALASHSPTDPVPGELLLALAQPR